VQFSFCLNENMAHRKKKPKKADPPSVPRGEPSDLKDLLNRMFPPQDNPPPTGKSKPKKPRGR
jgi:hypothetical protein